MATAADPLVSYLFDDKPHRLSGLINGWLTAAPRYKAFVQTYKDKIRKKIRITREEAGIGDLQFELEVAYWLAQERRFTIVYEPYASSKMRGPDFAVTFKSFTFNVEVTRIRPGVEEARSVERGAKSVEEGGTQGNSGNSGELEREEETRRQGDKEMGARLADTVGDKLGQMLPGMINLLVVGMDNEAVAHLDLPAAMVRMRERAERKEPGLLGRHGFSSTADFFKYYLRLSGVLVRGTGGEETAVPGALWLNKQTKHPLPANLRTILQGGILAP
jgi:hypothetical protein